MGKKSRSRRRKNGGADNSDDELSTGGAGGGADYLSESHTIDGFLSQGDNTTLGSIPDDSSWGIHDDDDEAYQRKKHISEDDAIQAAEATQQKLAEILGSTVPEFAAEKRSFKREAMLKMWFKSLTQYATMAPYEVVEQWREELVKACSQYALLRGSPSEQYAGCRVLEAMAILIGDHDLYEQLSKRLIRSIQSAHKAPPVRVSALRALGMLVFCGTDDEIITESVLDLCEEIVQGQYRGQATPPALRASAWQVWTLLATTIHELYVSGKTDESIGRGLVLLPLVTECLETDEQVLKEAAGQAMAYIHDCRLRLGVDALDGDEHQVENNTDAKYTLGSWEGSEWEDDVDEITQTIYELAHSSGHYLSKKAKKEQRHVFRDYLGMLQDNESPEVVVNFRGGTLELTRFGDVVALEFVKRCLQGGFQIQLLTNPTLQAIFGCDGDVLGHSNGYSQLEKRLFLSKTSEASKLKDQHRHKGRKKRQNVKDHFLTSDGDAI
jgi:hypothetical protein